MVSHVQNENPSGQTAVPERMRAEQVLLVFGQTKLNQIISPIIGALVAFTLWPVGNHKVLRGWVAMLAAISVSVIHLPACTTKPKSPPAMSAFGSDASLSV